MAEAVVDLAAVAHNAALLAQMAGPAALMAVVKANGFGHGAAEVARTALDHGATWLGRTESVEVARAAGLNPYHCHLANSAAALQAPESRLQLVRAGIALYGVEPVPHRSFGLRPAMTVQARVILTKRVPAGTGVSYGHDWT